MSGRVNRRRRGRNRSAPAHDLRPQYAALPAGPDLATAIIDDPYGAPAGAVATRDTARADWVPPARPQIVVVRSFRHDPLGRMHARRQVTNAEYLAGRAYQTLHETAGRRSIGNGWNAEGAGSHGSASYDRMLVTDEMLKADKRLRAVDNRLQGRFGTEGLTIVRAVLIEHQRLDAAATHRQTLRFVGALFRRCLDETAVLLGLATATKP